MHTSAAWRNSGSRSPASPSPVPRPSSPSFSAFSSAVTCSSIDVPEAATAVCEIGGREFVVFCASSYESVPDGNIAIFQGKPEAQGYYVFALPKTDGS